jgi:DNA invertase Pin-like site-specific DNA recombinase
MAVVGYARVSTLDQNLSGQPEALKAAGAPPRFIGRRSAVLKPRDIVLVTKLDRLGTRNCACVG